MNLLDLPRDIVLEIGLHTTLESAISLASICREFRSSYWTDHSFWLAAVASALRKNQTLACDPLEDVSLRSEKSLRNLVHRSAVLNKNLSRHIVKLHRFSHREPGSFERILDFNSDARLVLHIPEPRPMFLVYTTRMSLCTFGFRDEDESIHVLHRAEGIRLAAHDASSPVHTPLASLIAVQTNRWPGLFRELIVIKVDRTTGGISFPFRRIIGDETKSLPNVGPYFDGDIAAFFSGKNEMVAYNLASGYEVHIFLSKSLSPLTDIKLVPLRSTMWACIQTPDTISMIEIPRSCLPYPGVTPPLESTLNCSMAEPSASSRPEPEDATMIASGHFQSSHSGLHGFSLFQYGYPDQGLDTCICFYDFHGSQGAARSLISLTQKTLARRIDNAVPGNGFHIGGHVASATSSCFSCILLISGTLRDSARELVLVRRNTHEGTASFHHLKTPHSLNTRAVTAVSWDENTGCAAVLTMDGEVTVLWYN